MKTIVQLVEKLKIYLVDKDTKAKQAVEANIAPVEIDASSSSSAYAVGAQLILNDVLYDVTSSISVGDAIAVGTNITAASKLSVNIKSKQDQIEVTTMPTASASNVGKVLIYIGETTSTYTSGQSYQSTLEGGNYVWKPTSISSVDASDVNYDNETSGLDAANAQEAIDELSSQIGDKLGSSDIANNLTTTTTGKVLDATQGKALKDAKADKSELASISITGSTNNTGSTIKKGTFFYKSGVLVRASVDIANGATLTQNTNYTLVTAGALNESLAVITGSLTTSHTIDTANTDLRKSGNVVTLIFRITITSNVSAYSAVATLPSGFRPPKGFFIIDYSGAKPFGISNEGSLNCTVALSAGDVWRGQASWII